ncbi:MAG TPA: DNA repair protein RecO [Clostridiales bacterium]|uniref:DNA repair protein RecO n=1 Tax=Candidatus Egerieisoma faecipullorum TaxID=2840963 RepID=A0A9D1LAP1_9CLOT|nr:DNA repair protein RecO [Clostridiales bacterium]HIU30350.1 DNA repair protein RecO [Candidatus Egerieisoma faecipullorum]
MSAERHFKTEGIVLKESPLGENGKLLVIFSREYGKMTAAAKGVRKPGSAMIQLAQLFAYSELELYRGNSGLYTLTGGTLIEPFRGLSEDYDRIRAAGTMSSVLLKIIQEELPDEETLRLFLNSLYLIAAGRRRPDFVRCVFLLKLTQYQGLQPDPGEIERQWGKPLLSGTRAALRHLSEADGGDSLFGFGVSEDVLSELAGIASMLSHEMTN